MPWVAAVFHETMVDATVDVKTCVFPDKKIPAINVIIFRKSMVLRPHALYGTSGGWQSCYTPGPGRHDAIEGAPPVRFLGDWRKKGTSEGQTVVYNADIQ